MEANEEWRPVVKSFDYSVSNFGRVRRDTSASGTRSGRLLAGVMDNRGYLVVKIGREIRQVHLLVAEAFIGVRPVGWHTNHKNGVKIHNQLSNLEYVTPAENHAHARRLGLSHDVPPQLGERHHKAKLKESDVLAIRLRFNSGETIRSLATAFGRPYGTIWNVAYRKSWRHI